MTRPDRPPDSKVEELRALAKAERDAAVAEELESTERIVDALAATDDDAQTGDQG